MKERTIKKDNYQFFYLSFLNKKYKNVTKIKIEINK